MFYLGMWFWDMREIILASNNEHKIKEFKEMLPEDRILSLKDIWYFEDIKETGETFLENALIKARSVETFLKWKNISANIIADDSGLCVNALNWEPWVYSARYAWWHGNDQANRDKLLENLKKSSDRTAYIACVLVEIYPNGDYIFTEWRVQWRILEEERWDKSFGYDCVFFSDELNKSFWEATDEEKNLISHRGKAIFQLKELEHQKW